jgi:CheY-like chemotaxis protein/HPt (histidine-containing phosphotransfer) domain-containing protein
MPTKELSQELTNIFVSTLQNKLNDLCALIKLAEKRGFSRGNLFAIQNVIICIHSIAKSHNQLWASEIFETKVVRPLQLCVTTNSAPDAPMIETFREALRECHQRTEELAKTSRNTDISPFSSTTCGTAPQFNSLLSALGQISIWNNHEILGELTKAHAYSEMIENWVATLRERPIAAEIADEIQEMERIQERVSIALNRIQEVIRRSRGARGRIKQNKEIFMLSQLINLMLEVHSTRLDAKWIVEKIPNVDVIVDKSQFEFLWVSITKLFIEWLSPIQKMRAICAASEAGPDAQKVAFYVAIEPQSDAPIQTNFHEIDFTDISPMADVGCVFETCQNLARFWDIEIELGLNEKGYPVARFQLPAAGNQASQAHPQATQETAKEELSFDRKTFPQPPTTLLVDDDADLAFMLQKKLSRLGYPTVVATDIQSAKLMLSNQKIDIVISDLFLGQESGLDLLTSVRKQFPNLKFVFITGATTDDVSPGVAKLLAAHADATLTKPVDDDVLQDVMKKMLPS